MARTRIERINPLSTRPTTPLAPLVVGGYIGTNFISVDTRLPSNPRLVDRSRLPNGYTPADYHQMFSRLPAELEAPLRRRGNLEVTITIDERGNVVPFDSRSRTAPHSTYISAMIRRRPDGTNELVGIWGGRCGGGNNGAPAALSTTKLMSTPAGRLALTTQPILDAGVFNWSQAQLANRGSLSRDPHAWEFNDGGQSTFIPYQQGQTHGVRRQSELGEHHSRHDTWGCLSGSEESFRARLNARMVVMMGHNPPHPHDWGNALGIQNTSTAAAMVFVRNRDVAANVLGNVYHLNPLMFNTGNNHFQTLAQQLHVTPPRTGPMVAHTLPAHRPTQSLSHTPPTVQTFFNQFFRART